MAFPVLFDDHRHTGLLPLTFAKPIALLRCGILTLREKWKPYFGITPDLATLPYLRQKYPLPEAENCIFIYGGLLPSQKLLDIITTLKPGEAVFEESDSGGDHSLLVASGNCNRLLQQITEPSAASFSRVITVKPAEFDTITRPYHIFALNGGELQRDYKTLTEGRISRQLPQSNTLLGPADLLFIEDGAQINASVINTSGGPVYIGIDAEIMEGSLIRGPFAACRHSGLKMGAKVYGPTTLGPYCKAGGELNNVVFQEYSNKAHDGFLGNAVIGSWCNIGADTNNSNLKNNYTEVKLWDYVSKRFAPTGLQFCGLIMGDHSKCGINTMFNTGTSVGYSANIFGSGFPRPFIPSFTWGGAAKNGTYKLEAALETASLMMARRRVELTDTDIAIFEHIHRETAMYRSWETHR